MVRLAEPCSERRQWRSSKCDQPCGKLIRTGRSASIRCIQSRTIRHIIATFPYRTARSTRRRSPSITNCGGQLTIETFLLTPLDNHPPAHIEVRFHRFLRPERQFPTPDAFKTQILKDVSRAQTYRRRLSYVATSPK